MTINLIINGDKVELTDLTVLPFEEGETVFIYDENGVKRQYKVHNIIKSFRKIGKQVDCGLEVILA